MINLGETKSEAAEKSAKEAPYQQLTSMEDKYLVEKGMRRLNSGESESLRQQLATEIMRLETALRIKTEEHKCCSEDLMKLRAQYQRQPIETAPKMDRKKAADLAYAEGYRLGSASRDAEIAELVVVLGNVTAHLVAAHSLLSRGGKKAAASDTIFKIMLQDYEKSFEAGRKALAKVRKP